MCCGNDDAELWSPALLESVIIPSGQSVWHSAVAFQSPPFSPLVRHSSLPPPLAKADQSEQTCLYLCSSPLCFSGEITIHHPPAGPKIRLLAEAIQRTNESSQSSFPCKGNMGFSPQNAAAESENICPLSVMQCKPGVT